MYAQRYATLTLTKTVDDARPEPGQLITFTLTVATSSFVSATHALISDSLPSELNFVGPITLDPPSAGTPGTAPPILASELTISPNTRITLTFPVTVDMGLAKGTVCTNTAAVTSTEVITPRVGVQVVTIGQLSAVFLPVIARNYCSDFFDDFSSPSSGWEVVNDSFVRSEYLSGEYRILSKKAGYFYLFDAPTCKRQNYVVETDAWWVGTPGSGYGLVFGVTPGFNQFYLFDVNTDYQEFRLLRYDPSSGFNTIVSPTTAPAINGGNASNHLKVTRNGNQITLEVNGTVLGTWSDGTITGLTDVGVVSQPYGSRPSSDARFDNFSVTSLPGSSAAAQGLGGAAANGSQLPRTHYAPIPTDIGWRAR